MMTNAPEFSPFYDHDDDIGYLHFRQLANIVEEFIENISMQDEDLKATPIRDCDLEVWLGLNSIDFRHPHSKQRDDDYIAPVQYGATIMDVASSARKEPWAILTLLLIAFKEMWRGGHSHDAYDLLRQVKGRFSASIAREALRRLSREEEAKENERKRLADPDEQAPIDHERDIPF